MLKSTMLMSRGALYMLHIVPMPDGARGWTVPIAWLKLRGFSDYAGKFPDEHFCCM